MITITTIYLPIIILIKTKIFSFYSKNITTDKKNHRHRRRVANAIYKFLLVLIYSQNVYQIK